ncbi:hypothetical protein POSPLADRAFT_1185030 [Postia placenta MAD-698-R-SB12]|uniref:Exocyst complex component Sec10-like alpha-helical bundle domain-containing protein n=1 Tax=Postia placenta MAD-698-R-SB12 TaxID=670580 RepID=A0A1X6MP12_9APHY|nr:hypothetical protein POSPLADRAFT_1185030 [Postia placenta MAD-698-R-SB12]OSX58161.1 hypothetical protein POSPLADRAFT_1185030 [Postia placenta MAD-698-R-SB12]
MDKFTTLEPVRLYAPTTPTASAPRTLKNAQRLPGTPIRGPPPFQLIGRLPADLHILTLTYLAVPDFPAYALSSRALANLAKDERVWEARWRMFGVERSGLGDVLDALEEKAKAQNALAKDQGPPTLAVDIVDDEFGEFAAVNAQVGEMGDFIGAFSNTVIQSPAIPNFGAEPPKPTFRARYVRAHNLLKVLLPALSAPPHAVLSALFASPVPSLRQQAHILRLLSYFLSGSVKPIRPWEAQSAALRAAIDRFEDALLTAFDTADGNNNEDAMREAAEASWEVRDQSDGSWELGAMWAEKREIFYEQSRWRALDNFTYDGQLDFDAMDTFMGTVLSALKEHGSRAVRVFPPETNVLISFADRLASDVVGEYVSPLLTRAREVSNEIFLKAAAASFKEAWRMVDVITQIAAERSDSNVSKARAEDVVYRMFEPNMDEYLDEEVDFVKHCFEVTCGGWENQLSHRATVPKASPDHVRFLGSQNPAQVKRNVLASFTDVLLLPVTIVPRTVGNVGKAVGAAFNTGSNAAVQGISMLNPQRWGGGGLGGTSQRSSKATRPTSVSSRTSTPSQGNNTSQFDTLELLLSLDIALELIHADRESLKRAETFSGYPGQYGHRVRDTIEEIFVLLLQALSERHMRPGFDAATQQMKAYQPAEHEETRSVAPLLQFFELVHVGDMMQSMIQVYFDKELVPHIDRTDFLNTGVREKKRFEDTLDDCVAAGLNAGTDALMNQVEYIINKFTKPREYYPSEDAPLELGPTQGCTEAIKCLKMHCQLLKGSTSKEVLEVFYQEIGLRLISIIQKHLKRQIISLNGGFQVIADLNEYHGFVSSLKVSSVTSEFSYLKMLGHVYVVEDAKDLAQIVRDVTRYGGAYKPEDIYEYIQRRADWKKIEKTVDKTMYNLSFKEDCAIC